MGSLWRGWKARLKDKYYYENLTNPEKLFEVPDKVSSDQWPTLVRFWNTEETEVYKYCIFTYEFIYTITNF